MASDRSRANRSLGNKINSIDSRVSAREKSTTSPHLGLGGISDEHIADGTITEASIMDRAITETKIARGAVGLEHLGADAMLIGTPSGNVELTAQPTAPEGWLICDGTTLSAEIYPSLYAAIGYRYGGSEDGFNTPDLRGLAPVPAVRVGGAALRYIIKI